MTVLTVFDSPKCRRMLDLKTVFADLKPLYACSPDPLLSGHRYLFKAIQDIFDLIESVCDFSVRNDCMPKEFSL